MIYDFAIIGAGIVGLATAREILRRRPGASLILVEKENTIAAHQTGHNSGVVHAGIYYAPRSLKAKFCREGAAATKLFCAEHGIPIKTCGKLLVATSRLECARMADIYERAKLNGIEARPLSRDELIRIEPNIAGEAALLVPSTAIVDYKVIAATLARLIKEKGAEIELGEAVMALREEDDGVVIGGAKQGWRARFLIVCAGLQSDRLAKLAGLKIGHRIIPFRGEFYRLPPERAGLINHLIYPIPDPQLPFVGIHLTKTIDGQLIAGPSAVLALAREGYGKYSLNLRDVSDTLAFAGFWNVARTHFSAGIKEIRNFLSKRAYLAECQKYCPDLKLSDLEQSFAGIRAQAVSREGALIHDFLFKETARMLHVLNAPSPAATSAPPIANMIAGKTLSR